MTATNRARTEEEHLMWQHQTPTVMKLNVLTGTITDRQYQNLLYKIYSTCPTCQQRYNETLTIKITK